ncbi:unknown [Acidiphilium sp. CAG:727]|nr:unknown [Acidiphilium sp. CAG:727]
MPSATTGYSRSSAKLTFLPQSSLKALLHIATSLNFRMVVSSIAADGRVGVVTTAISAMPFLMASTACGVEWLLILSRIPGYNARYFFNAGRSTECRATSLVATKTEPVFKF